MSHPSILITPTNGKNRSPIPVEESHPPVDHPERFVRGRPTLPAFPQAVWINKPKEETDDGQSSLNPDGLLSQRHRRLPCHRSEKGSVSHHSGTPATIPTQ